MRLLQFAVIAAAFILTALAFVATYDSLHALAAASTAAQFLAWTLGVLLGAIAVTFFGVVAALTTIFFMEA